MAKRREKSIRRSEYEHLFYFDRAVLASYRASPDLYRLVEDDMGGELTTFHNGEDDNSLPTKYAWFRVRFGLRRLRDGRVCIAAFGPDLKELPEQHLKIWSGHHIESLIFAEQDPAFERFANRFLEGHVGTQSGPLERILDLIELIRSLTRQTLGRPLCRSLQHPLLHYPVAENTDAYAKAHLELYRLLIDGLDSQALRYLADKLQITVSDPSKTLNTIKELLPSELVPIVHASLKKCVEERNKIHGVSEKPISPFPAFDTFRSAIETIADGLSEFKTWLEGQLASDAEACLSRENALYWTFPKFRGPPLPEIKRTELQRAIGKTIQSVEFGEVDTPLGAHQSEAIILHFKDGSSMAIRVGSNAINLADKFPELKPEDVYTDLMIFWAPSIDKEP
ncbi:MAG: hypothetical protein AB7P69_18140 [Candidatus Binatia bacterium]